MSHAAFVARRIKMDDCVEWVFARIAPTYATNPGPYAAGKYPFRHHVKKCCPADNG